MDPLTEGRDAELEHAFCWALTRWGTGACKVCLTPSSNPDGYRVARNDLKGRHSAGEGFLTAFLQHSSGPDVCGLCETAEHFADFSRAVAQVRPELVPQRVTRLDLGILEDRALLNLPHPELAREALLRAYLGHERYALCGVTHTIASQHVISEIINCIVAPVMPWDALVCTSRAVHDAVESVLARAEDNLRDRIGATRFLRPLLQVIPLGVHAARFASKEENRKRWRTTLGIDAETIVVLFFGRLSVHAKSSPFQLAQAVEIAAQQGRKRYAVLWCGWFSNDFQRQTFMTTAKSMAPSVSFYEVDGRNADARFSIWPAADIFCSLSDNIQETFGLTVIEAMAAGLPVVASNWNGYRDTVEHGVSGILVDTAVPSLSLADVAYRYLANAETYDLFVGAISQLCIVDVGQVAEALMLFGTDAEARRCFGSAAKRTVAAKFDWSVILQKYAELWQEQISRLLLGRAEASTGRRWNCYDPAVTFASYPSGHLSDATLIEPGPHYDSFSQLIRMPGIISNPHVLMREKALRALHSAAGAGQPLAIADLLKPLDPELRGPAVRSLHWMIKIGVLRVAPSGE